jgi:hypothetical protein
MVPSVARIICATLRGPPPGLRLFCTAHERQTTKTTDKLGMVGDLQQVRFHFNMLGDTNVANEITM